MVNLGVKNKYGFSTFLFLYGAVVLSLSTADILNLMILYYGSVLLIVRWRAASLAFAHWMPVTPHQLGQPKSLPNMATGTIAPREERVVSWTALE